MFRYRMRYRTTQDLSRERVIEQEATSAADLARRVRDTEGTIFILQLEEAPLPKPFPASS
ncbi:MAG TPA: hypothetical protein VGR25_02260 [bacterium]|jgi:hypothetical protein|nr:hypothetical protein [bacterium]